MEQTIHCPFCGFKTDREYQIMLHLETMHPEGGHSPFIPKDNASVAGFLSEGNGDGDEDPDFASCPIDGCGEVILLTELDSHIEMHDVEDQDVDQGFVPNSREQSIAEATPASFDTKLSRVLRNLNNRVSPSEGSSSDRQAKAKATWKGILAMPDTNKKPISPTTKGSRRRLGKAELGPHANENRMPHWLVKVLESDGELKSVNRLGPDGKMTKVKVAANHAAGILPVVAQLLEQDNSTQFAYLCHSSVRHISKLRREGGFCGYRNIQMLTSYINGVKSQGHECFNNKIPTIFQIQDYIENAWDLGINAQGRIETGGIRLTRKYIGTPDAQAMFCSLGIACDAQALRAKKDAPQAPELLLQAVESYFMNGCTDFESKVRLTSLPPLYFQHPGHSMTIVGIERRKDGSTTLLVFDPMFHDASDVMKLVDQTFAHKAPETVLKAYRRDVKYLSKYNEFELLKLTPPKSQAGNVVMGSW